MSLFGYMQGSTTINLGNASATGWVALTQANVTSSTHFYCTATYIVQ
jgi:hypothetical protein